MELIYAVGVLNIDSGALWKIKDSRLWSLYKSFENAEKAVLENRGDLFENYYNYALIEETIVVGKKEQGIGFPPKQWWFKADYKGDAINIHSIDIPKEFAIISNWWVG